MHILYIHQHFALPSGSTGTRSYEFVLRWVKAGHKVTVISGKYDIGGLKTGDKLIEHHNVDSVDVIVAGICYSNKQSFIRRIWSFIVFMAVGTFAGLRVKEVDIVYVTSTPLTVGIPAMIIKWAKRVPFVFEVRDQWPEVPIEMGIIKNKVLAKALLWLEKVIYRQSAAIVALSPGQADGVKRVLGEEKPITVIPNGCDTDIFRPDIDGSVVRQEKNWGDKLVFLHAGAMGKINNLGFVIDAAERLKGNNDIHFVLLGEGSEKPSLVQRVKKAGLKNVEILDLLPKTQLPGLIAAYDVSIIIVAKYTILQHNSANKFFDSLSAGKPVLLNYSGWQRLILEQNNAGFGCELCDLDEFVKKVLYLHSNKQKLIEMGQNSRRVAEEKFSRDKLANQALKVISSLVM